jgi:hypothetical protein
LARKKGKFIISSLQSLDEKDSLLRLDYLIMQHEDCQKGNMARAMKTVQEHLMYGDGYLLFDEAYHLFVSFFEFSPNKLVFRDKLLDAYYGLNVLIVTIPVSSETFVVLKNSSKLQEFLNDFFVHIEEEYSNILLTSNNIDSLKCL